VNDIPPHTIRHAADVERRDVAQPERDVSPGNALGQWNLLTSALAADSHAATSAAAVLCWWTRPLRSTGAAEGLTPT
jgi:hypothetical protein